ncbi:MAG: hypothetical protein AAF664_20860, partial [Planctomycetota bacterium]
TLASGCVGNHGLATSRLIGISDRLLVEGISTRGKIMTDHSKVSIIGTGHVGSALGFACVIRELADEIVLVNRTRAKAQGEAADLNHAAAFVSRAIHVREGEIEDTRDSDVVVVTHSIPLEGKFEDRMQLAANNVDLFREWMPPLAAVNPKAVFVIVSNPVDVLSYIAWRLTGLPSNQVIGSGTIVDSVRFRASLSNAIDIHPDDIRAYILGEHGKTQFPLLSMSMTGGETLDGDDRAKAIFEETREEGIRVYELKGYTNYAIAMSTTLIIESVVRDSRRTLPVSTYVADNDGVDDVYLSQPVVVGSTGVRAVLHPTLNDEETEQWQASGKRVSEVLRSLGF